MDNPFEIGNRLVITKVCRKCGGDAVGKTGKVVHLYRDGGARLRLDERKERYWKVCHRCAELVALDRLSQNEEFIYG